MMQTAMLIMQTGTLIAAIVVAVIYGKQLSEMRKQFFAAALQELLVFLESPHVRNARYIVMRELREAKLADPDKYSDIDRWSHEERKAVSTALGTYDLAGTLAQQKGASPLLPIIKSHYGISIVQITSECKLFIDYMRGPERGGRSYYQDLLWLARKCDSMNRLDWIN